MKKLSIQCLLLGLLIGTNLIADDGKRYYFGINAVKGSGIQSRTYDDNTISNVYESSQKNEYETEYDISGVDLKWGHIFKNNNRIEIGAELLRYKYSSQEPFTLGTNKTSSGVTSIYAQYLLTLTNNPKFLPYLLIGGSSNINNNFDGYNKSSGEEQSFAAGIGLKAGLGVLSELSENIEVSLKYQISGITYNIENVDVKETNKYLNIGLNIKF